MCVFFFLKESQKLAERFAVNGCNNLLVMCVNYRVTLYFIITWNYLIIFVCLYESIKVFVAQILGLFQHTQCRF